MRLALDTNRYADLMRGERSAVMLVEQADHLWLPFPVVAELRCGFLLGKYRKANESKLNEFLALGDVSVVYADAGTILQYAALRTQLMAQGTPIPINDIWIASLVLQHGLILATRDTHFSHLPQIPRV